MSDPRSVTDTKEKEDKSTNDTNTNSVEKKDSEPQTVDQVDESSTVKSITNETSETPETPETPEALETPMTSTQNKNSKKPWPKYEIKEPHENDVLYGRGGGTNHHPGNKRYRAIVETRKEDYINSKRLDKPLVALEIIKQWRSQDPPGRFLKQDEATGMWNDVGDKKAREKTSQALREKAPQSKISAEKNRGNKDNSRSPTGSENYHSPNSSSSLDKNTKPRPMLMRDHTIGRSELDQQPFDYQGGFSWDAPLQRFSSLHRLNSLAANPLPQTNLTEPGRPDYFIRDYSHSPPDYNPQAPNDSHHRWSETRNYNVSQEMNPGYGFTDVRHRQTSSSSHKRHASFETLPKKSYETEIAQSWSSGRQDEYSEAQNPGRTSSWEKYDKKPTSRTFAGYPEEYGRHSNPTIVRSSSHINQPHSHNFYYKQRESPPRQDGRNSPYKSTPARSHMSSNHRNTNHDMEKRKSPTYEPDLLRRESHNSYLPDHHKLETHHPYPSYSDKFDPIQYPSTSRETSPTKGNFDDVFEKKSKMSNYKVPRHVDQQQQKNVYTHDRSYHHYNHSGHSTLSRPTRIKRDTSNQNEEAGTKKNIKMMKRPGLNRENSIRAQLLREEQQQKISNYESSYRTKNDPSHLTHATLDDDVSIDMFVSPNDLLNDSKEQLPFDQSELEDKFSSDNIPIDDDIRTLSNATNEIDLGSKSPDKPPALKMTDRLSTIEYIQKLIEE